MFIIVYRCRNFLEPNFPFLYNEQMMLDDDVLKRIGSAIKVLRMEKGLSQQALSESCQVDRGFISSVERGVRNISVVTLCMIVNQLGMDFVSFAKWMDSSK